MAEDVKGKYGTLTHSQLLSVIEVRGKQIDDLNAVVDLKTREAQNWKEALNEPHPEDVPKQPLTLRQMEDILSHLSYKPGWTFQMYEGKWEGTHLVINTQVEDAFNPGTQTTLDVQTFFPPVFTEQQFMATLIWRLKRLETHELREFLQWDGKPYDDPHADGADKDLP